MAFGLRFPLSDGADLPRGIGPPTYDPTRDSLYDQLILRDLPGYGSYWPMYESSVTSGFADRGAMNTPLQQTIINGIPVKANAYVGPIPNDPVNQSVFTFPSRLAILTNDYFFPGNSPYTVGMWVYPLPDEGSSNQIPFFVVCGLGLRLHHNFDGTVSMVRGNPSVSNTAQTTIKVNNMRWTYVMGTYDGVSLRIYIDGVLAAGPVSSSLQVSLGTEDKRRFTLGSTDIGGQNYRGYLARPFVASTAYPASIALEHTLAGRPGDPAPALEYRTLQVVFGGGGNRYAPDFTPPPTIDTDAVYLSLIPDSTDAYDYTDSNTEVFALTASASETADFVDADTEVFALTPSTSAEEHTTYDTDTEIFALTPSTTDTAQYVDAVTETFKLTPSATDIEDSVDTDKEYLQINPLSSNWTDDFDDNSIDVKRWQTTGTVAEQNQRLECPATNDALNTSGFVSLPDTLQVKMPVINGATSNAVVKVDGYLPGLSGSAVLINLNNSRITASFGDDDFNTVSASGNITHTGLPIWVRIRRTAPGIVIEYSTNGTSWTSLVSGSVDYRWMNRTRTTLSASLVNASGLITFDDYMFIGNIIDTAQYVEANTVNFALTPIATVDEHTTYDAATELFALTPSSADTAQYVDAVTETLGLTPSSTDTAQYVDSTTASQTLDPSAADFYDDFDNNSLDVRWSVVQGAIFEQNKHIEAFNNTPYTTNPIIQILGTSSFESVIVKIENYSGLTADGNIAFSLQGIISGSFNDGINLIFAGTDLTANIRSDAGVQTQGQINGFSGDVWIRFRRTHPGILAEYSVNGTSWTTIHSTANEYKWFNRVFTKFLFNRGTNHDQRIATLDNYALIGSQIDTAQFVETNTINFALTPSATDVAGFVDAATEYVLLSPSSTDILQATDSATESFALTPTATDTAQFVDANTEPLALVPSASEEYTTYDLATENFILTPSGTDEYTGGSVEYTDAATENFALVPSASDVAEFADTYTETLALSPSAADVSVFVDSATEFYLLIPTSTDEAAYVESAIETLSLVPSGSDVLDTLDADTEIFTLSASGTDAIIYGDSGQENLSLLASSVDTAQFVDQNTELYKLTPFGDEYISGQTVDAATETFTLIPVSTDTADFVDSAIEVLVFSPDASEQRISTDTELEYLRLLAFGTDIADYVDGVVEDFVITPGGAEEYAITQADAGTLYLHLTPSGLEVWKLVQLVGKLYRHYLTKLEASPYSMNIAFRRWRSRNDYTP